MELKTRHDLINVLNNNPGIIFIKLGATWCRPCTLIAGQIHDVFAKMPRDVMTFDVDIDVSADLFAYLKTKKMVVGVPTILCYHAGNASFVPDDSVSGTDLDQIYKFFHQNLAGV